jgi:hypothetical protein
MKLSTWTKVQRLVQRRASQQRSRAEGTARASAIAVLAALLFGCAADDAGRSGGPATEPCDGVTCAADQYCAYPLGDCGKGGVVPGNYGVCQLRPTSCDTATPREVCGCDGRAHENACEAARAGMSIGAGEECGGAAPPGRFGCGSYFCKLPTEYCQTIEDADDEPLKQPPRHTCVTIPSSCMAEPSCACLAAASGAPVMGGCSAAPTCTGDASGGFALRCPGNLY